MEVFFIRIFKEISKKTYALIWLYLQINGKPSEKLHNELRWSFDRNNFKSAVTCLMLDDEEEMDKMALQMKGLILKHFDCDKELADWSRDIFKQVTVISKEKMFQSNFSLHHPFQKVSFMCQL